jgi:hypothetical protein
MTALVTIAQSGNVDRTDFTETGALARLAPAECILIVIAREE